MIYETEIKLPKYNITINIEFDNTTEEFSYTIKERKKANAKKEGTEKDSGNTDTNREINESRDTGTEEFL